MLRCVSRFLRIGQIMAMVCPMPLLASVPMEYFKEHVSHTAPCGEDALMFQTRECRVLVLADEKKHVAAILLHTKTRKQKAEKWVEKLVAIAPTDGEDEVIYSADGFSALVLYGAAEKTDSGIYGMPRLTALRHIFSRSDFGVWSPHRWHDCGVSFRCYANEALLMEVTLPMNTPAVSYAEVRVKGSQNETKKIVRDLLNMDAKKSQGSLVQRLSAKVNKGYVIHADPEKKCCIVWDRMVYTVTGYSTHAPIYREREDVNDYHFTKFVFPTAVAKVQMPNTAPPAPTPNAEEPEEVSDTTPKTETEPKVPVKVYTPEEARKAYIDYLKTLRG